MAITKEQVFKVCDAMFAEGENPTLINIRKALGSGSFSTISNMLAEWKAASPKEDVPIINDLPEDLQDQLDALGRRFLAAAVKVADENAAKAQAEADARVAEAHAGRTEALDALQAVQAELDQVVSKNMVIVAERDQALEQLRMARQEEATLKAQCAELRQVNAELFARVGLAPVVEDRPASSSTLKAARKVAGRK